MGYPSFGKVKTIVLPEPNDSPISIDKYKELYGIDVRDMFVLETLHGFISLKNLDNAVIYIKPGDNGDMMPGILRPVIDIESITYLAGNRDAMFKFDVMYDFDNQEYWGLIFKIDKDSSFGFESMTVVVDVH